MALEHLWVTQVTRAPQGGGVTTCPHTFPRTSPALGPSEFSATPLGAEMLAPELTPVGRPPWP